MARRGPGAPEGVGDSCSGGQGAFWEGLLRVPERLREQVMQRGNTRTSATPSAL